MNKKVRFIFAIMFLLLSAGISFSQTVVNEIMYAPTDATNEWFELYNRGTAAVSLRNWKWKDGTNVIKTITTQSISLNPSSYVVVCEDTVKFKAQFPGLSLLMIQSSGWNALNNTGDALVILDSSNAVVDTLSYLTSWGGSTGGFSLERINPAGSSVLGSNWGTTLDPLKGTPGRKNSITPKGYDLILKTFTLSPLNPAIGDSLKFNFEIKNAGINPASSYSLNIFRDDNKDSIAQPAELLISQPFTNLIAGDSVLFNYGVVAADSGLKQFIGLVVFAQDEDTLNNKLIRSVNVGGSVISAGLVINEIMYDPQTPEPEWIELCNVSAQSINIKNWKIADSTTLNSPIIITSSDVVIAASSYLVIAKTNTIFGVHKLIDSSKVIFLSNLPTLNNDKDRITIFNNSGTVIDYVSYKSNWGGGKPYSLERISPTNMSQDSTNWTTSMDCEFSSPTRQNSFSGVTGAAKNDIIINEIMYDPLTGQAEWVELFNPTGKLLNLTGWRLSESSSFHHLYDTCNFKINPGDYVILAADTTIYTRYSYLKTPSSNQKVIIKSGLSLTNDGEPLKVLDVLNDVIDSVYYSPKWNNPNIPDTKGYSLERINPKFSSNDKFNWSTCANINGGTPGIKNSIYADNPDIASNISVFPNPFSPDNDGFEDFAVIKYKIKSAVAMLRVKVYDTKGRLVRTLQNTQISGSEGSIVFNGLNDDGERLRIGIYVLFLEAIDDRGGTVETLKIPVVVATKL